MLLIVLIDKMIVEKWDGDDLEESDRGYRRNLKLLAYFLKVRVK
jgi:hypothetical protein